MLGAFIGDIVGSRFEWHNIKTKNFDLFTNRCFFTDDTVMTAAVADALLSYEGDYSVLSPKLIENMQNYGKLYPNRGYGGHFIQWIYASAPKPYNSWGNGSAMRVSPCGWIAGSLEEAEKLAEISACVTHNHPEGIKGAKATAAAVYLAKSGKSKEEIREYIVTNYYSLDFTLDEIRPAYRFDVSCQGSVPQALEAFFESENFEDSIRNAISIGGDSDTIAAITGSIAEAYYGIPSHIRNLALTYLDSKITSVLNEFEERCK